MMNSKTRKTGDRSYIPIWMLITLGIVIAIFMFVFGVGFGLRGNIPESIAGFFPSPTDTDIVDQSALSQEAILQVINTSIQTGKPLYLVGDNLSGANLVGANLSGANLSMSDLSHVDMYGANMSGANLFGAYLLGADLRGADLSKADLRKAYLGKTDLRSTNLRTANLNDVMLDGAWYSESTSWPQGLDPESSGAVIRK